MTTPPTTTRVEAGTAEQIANGGTSAPARKKAKKKKKKVVRRKTRTTRRRAGDIPIDPDRVELMSLVANLVSDGVRPSEIPARIEASHQIHMHREEVYRLIGYAAERGRMRYIAPPEEDLTRRLRDAYPWLESADVAHTATSADVAARTADALLKLLQSPQRGRVTRVGEKIRREVHVGFAGGHAMRNVARNLARLLADPAPYLPDRIVLHALVSGFDIHDPTTSPPTFFTYFVDEPAIPAQVEFVGLSAPPAVSSDRFEEFTKLDLICEAFERRDELDIIVTSGGSWTGTCEHSMLKRHMERSSAAATLEAAGCIGDILWRPIGEDGPITMDTESRAMTLMELTDLPPFIRAGNAVLFMLGPCLKCGHPRADLLRSILNYDEHLLTHVVTDSRTAAGALSE